MRIRDMQAFMHTEGKGLSPDTPVIFYTDAQEIPRRDEAYEGVSIAVDRYWESPWGWHPCVAIRLGRIF